MHRLILALPLFALVAGCGVFVRDPFAGATQSTVAQACTARAMPGASSPAFCACLDNEARYAANGDARTYKALIALTEERVDTANMSRMQTKRFEDKRNDWRVMLQNSGLRCARHAPGVEPFFGFTY